MIFIFAFFFLFSFHLTNSVFNWQVSLTRQLVKCQQNMIPILHLPAQHLPSGESSTCGKFSGCSTGSYKYVGLTYKITCTSSHPHYQQACTWVLHLIISVLLSGSLCGQKKSWLLLWSFWFWPLSLSMLLCIFHFQHSTNSLDCCTRKSKY